MKRIFSLILALLAAGAAHTQQMQPLIAEYTGSAEGFFQVKNEGIAPQIVTLEPKSFSLNEDGNGIFRPLDPAIHLELSASSVRLEPQASARIFYRAKADALPAWFTVYASFSPARETQGVNLRIMLPHTVYLYSRDELQRSDIVVSGVHYDAALRHVRLELENHGRAAGRISEVEVGAGRGSQISGGFPMLPGSRRVVTVDWTADKPPHDLRIQFARFDLKLAIPAEQE